MIETGTAIAGINVARPLRRNRNTTSVTRVTEISSVISVSRKLDRIVVVRSLAISRSISVGIAAISCGIAAFTPSTVSMMLAPGWRNRMTRTAGLPLARPALRKFSTESCTSATSDRRMAPRLRYATTSGW